MGLFYVKKALLLFGQRFFLVCRAWKHKHHLLFCINAD
jgi:hypothetical protein